LFVISGITQEIYWTIGRGDYDINFHCVACAEPINRVIYDDEDEVLYYV